MTNPMIFPMTRMTESRDHEAGRERPKNVGGAVPGTFHRVRKLNMMCKFEYISCRHKSNKK